MADRPVPAPAQINQVGRNVGHVELSAAGLRSFLKSVRGAAPEHIGKELAEGNAAGTEGSMRHGRNDLAGTAVVGLGQLSNLLHICTMAALDSHAGRRLRGMDAARGNSLDAHVPAKPLGGALGEGVCCAFGLAAWERATETWNAHDEGLDSGRSAD